jgi:methyl-accepting chemotaxis protein
MREAQAYAITQNSKVAETLDSFEGIEQSMLAITSQIEQIHNKIDQTRNKNEKLVESAHRVAPIAQETAAGVEQVHSTSIQQDASIHSIAVQSDDILSLSQQLFAEISKFQMDMDDNAPVMSESSENEESQRLDTLYKSSAGITV